MTRAARSVRDALLLLATGAFLAALPWIGDLARAALVLAHVAGRVPPALARVESAVDEEALALRLDGETTRARLYSPRGATRPAGLVLIPGAHAKGIDEPRVASLARGFAAVGLRVLAVELPALRELRVEEARPAMVRAAARELRARDGGRVPGVLGVSFAGGVALVAAAEPGAERDLAFVATIGAHDDLRRVATFAATGAIATPDGGEVRTRPHGYGAVAMLYAHPELAFPPGEAAAARAALGAALCGDRAAALALADALPPASRAIVRPLLDDDLAPVSALVLDIVRREGDAMLAVSPAPRLRDVRVPVYLLHGAGDPLVPASETAWLARGTDPMWLRAALVSDAIHHAELGGAPSAWDRLALASFVAELVRAAREE